MKIKPIKGYIFFWLITLVVFSLVGFLGIRTIEHQVLLSRYQVEDQAKQQLSLVDQFIGHQLTQKATRLEAIADFLQLTDESINQFVSKDSDVNHLFVLENNQLVFPRSNQMSMQWAQFVSSIEPIVEDPNLLFAPYMNDEQATPTSGWYINYNRQIPVLIYWCKKGNTIIGFNVSYVGLLSTIINEATFDVGQGSIDIVENGRLLYQSSHQAYPLLVTQNLNYPLTNWQINYYGKPASSLVIYLWGSAIVLLLLVFIGIVMFSLYREYRRANRQAMQQVNFVSQVSHELKTPLTNITLYAELLREELEQEEEDQQVYTDVIIQESQRLSRLIQNILSFTKAPKIHVTTFDISAALQGLSTTFKPSFMNRGIDLVVTIPPSVMVNSDEDRVMQIICNFLSNAEKYASQGKRVDLSLQVKETFIDINVRDYGKGIEPKEHTLIFKPFYRINACINEGVAGTGIGLTIAKQLANALNAEILVSNQQPGVCFTCRLKKGMA